MIKKSIVSSVVCTFLYLTVAYAEEGDPAVSISYAPEECSFLERVGCLGGAICSLSFDNFYVSHIEGRGIGYRYGYTTLGTFLSPGSFSDNICPFIDLRGHVFNNGKWAVNAGLGIRYLDESHEAVFGGNVYYDYRRDRSDYNQIGVGWEMLTQCYALRINGYIPVGRKNYRGSTNAFFYSDGFFATATRRESAFGGVDAEIETSLNRWGFGNKWDLYAAIGPYYYGSHHRREYTTGGKIRIGVEYMEYITLEVRASYDPIFHGIVQGLLGVTIPFGGCNSSPCCDPCASYLAEIAAYPIQRNEIIVLKKCCDWAANF